MAPWGWIAGGYGVFLTLTAIGLRDVNRRPVAMAGGIAYTLGAVGTSTLTTFWVQFVVPGALLLTGYWLSGLLFGPPQAWLETWLLESDRQLFDLLRVNERLAAWPRVLLELLEAAYVSDYVVVAVGASTAAIAGGEHMSRYWTIVLAAELTCYGALPFLRSRPPRSLEAPGVIARRAPALRRLNTAILDRASVQANTIPSGHVAGAVAAALAVMPVSVEAGWCLMLMAVLITVAAIAGRYHYAIDCALGAAVAALVAAIAAQM